MKQNYEVHYNENLDKTKSRPYKISVEEVGECPCCHFATSPTYLDGFMVSSKENNIPTTVFLSLYCSRCKNTYFAKYTSKTGTTNLQLEFVFPKEVVHKAFSDNINNLSPEFVSIYNQALKAETDVATQGLAGLGYRKSIEFLVKDYLINLKHQNKDTIIKMELGNCVSKLDPDLQDIARASTWIGNDEVHYFRKNPEYNIADLKEFIDCLVFDIEREYIKIKAKNLTHSK